MTNSLPFTREFWCTLKQGIDQNKTAKCLFAPLVKESCCAHESFDIAYGDDPRQKLDIFHSEDGIGGKPLVLYVPGGGFTGGDKRQSGGFFENVGRFFGHRGFVAATMNYRLAPLFQWPAAALDIASAVDWLKQHAGDFSFDPQKIVLIGHSAGATHCGSYIFDPDIKGSESVAGAVLCSGLYVLRRDELQSNAIAYFGNDEMDLYHRSSTAHVAGSRIPVMLACAEEDLPHLAASTFELGTALAKRDKRPPHLVWLEGHNHYSTVCSIGTADERLSDAIMSFCSTVLLR